MIGNAIVQRELVRAARRRINYWGRAGLPALAGLVLVGRVWLEVRSGRVSWLEVARLSRSLFELWAWLLFIVLSVLSFSAGASVQEEWKKKTMEVLCTTPLSWTEILLSKLAVAFGKVLMAALALLPFAATLFYVAHVPWEIGLGALAVIASSVLLCGSVSLSAAARISNPKQKSLQGFWWVLVYPLFFGYQFFDHWPWLRRPVFEVWCLPRALHVVLSATGSGSLGPGAFALLTFGLWTGMSAIVLVVGLRGFGRSLETRLTGAPAQARTWFSGRYRGGKKGVPRPPLEPDMDPFFWQELGQETKALGWSVYWLYGGITAVFVVISAVFNEWMFFTEGLFFYILAFFGLMVVVASPGSYATKIFAREKARHTAHALLLTGSPPDAIFRAKIRAMYWVLRYSFPPVLVAVLLLLLYLAVTAPSWLSASVAVAMSVLAIELVFFGPGLAALIGMVFGMLAGPEQKAGLWIMLPLIVLMYCATLFGVLTQFFRILLPLGLFALVASVVVARSRLRGRTGGRPWHAALLLTVQSLGIVGTVLGMGGLLGFSSGWFALVCLVVVNALVAVYAWTWWHVGVSMFEAAMAQEPVGASRASYP